MPSTPARGGHASGNESSGRGTVATPQSDRSGNGRSRSRGGGGFGRGNRNDWNDGNWGWGGDWNQANYSFIDVVPRSYNTLGAAPFGVTAGPQYQRPFVQGSDTPAQPVPSPGTSTSRKVFLIIGGILAVLIVLDLLRLLFLGLFDYFGRRRPHRRLINHR